MFNNAQLAHQANIRSGDTRVYPLVKDKIVKLWTCFVIFRHCVKKTMDTDATTTISNQEAFYQRLLEQLSTRPNVPGVDDIKLPPFTVGKDDPLDWCAEAETVVTTFGWNDHVTLSKVAGSFRGEASNWFERWNPPGKRTWDQLKLDVCESFAGSTDVGELIFKAVNFSSDGCVDFGEYGRTKL